MTLPAQTSLRRPHGALKAWITSLSIGDPVRVGFRDAESLRTCAWNAGLRATIRKVSPSCQTRIFTIVGTL